LSVLSIRNNVIDAFRNKEGRKEGRGLLIYVLVFSTTSSLRIVSMRDIAGSKSPIRPHQSVGAINTPRHLLQSINSHPIKVRF
jgi:hypothetical protein